MALIGLPSNDRPNAVHWLVSSNREICLFLKLKISYKPYKSWSKFNVLLFLLIKKIFFIFCQKKKTLEFFINWSTIPVIPYKSWRSFWACDRFPERLPWAARMSEMCPCILLISFFIGRIVKSKKNVVTLYKLSQVLPR